MKRTLLVAVTALWLTVIVGCTSPGITESEAPVQTTITGRFDGEARNYGGGCAWLETEDGERVEVVYPNGWWIEFDPPAVFDDAGTQRAIAGELVTIDGYFGEVGASVCDPDRIFVATDITEAGQ